MYGMYRCWALQYDPLIEVVERPGNNVESVEGPNGTSRQYFKSKMMVTLFGYKSEIFFDENLLHITKKHEDLVRSDITIYILRHLKVIELY